MDIHFVLYDNLNIQINTNNRDYITAVDKHLTDYVKGYLFMPKYKRGGWNGTISVFNRPKRSFPYGLLLEVIKYTKKEWGDLDLTISNDVKSMYKGLTLSEIKKDLVLIPYPYQQECINSLLKSSKGIVEVATAGGKSLIIAYLIHNIDKVISYNNSLIIVPTLQLVDQFKGDLVGYGIPDSDIGIVNSKHKEFDERIVISTWQSLQNQMQELDRFNTVIADECVDGDTLIKTNNTDIKIKDIKIGDEIISYNINKQIFEVDVVCDIFINNIISNNEDMYELILEDGNILKITGNHKVLTNEGYKQVKDLEINDDILSYSI